jgi:hypothetical protein
MLVLLLSIYALVDVGRVSDVSDIHAASAISVEVSRSFEQVDLAVTL